MNRFEALGPAQDVRTVADSEDTLPANTLSSRSPNKKARFILRGYRLPVTGCCYTLLNTLLYSLTPGGVSTPRLVASLPGTLHAGIHVANRPHVLHQSALHDSH